MEQRFNNALKRLAESEQAFCIFKEETQERFYTQEQKLKIAEQQIAELTAKYNEAVARFNAAAEMVNALSERIAALEANYDPTIIN